MEQVISRALSTHGDSGDSDAPKCFIAASLLHDRSSASRRRSLSDSQALRVSKISSRPMLTLHVDVGIGFFANFFSHSTYAHSA